MASSSKKTGDERVGRRIAAMRADLQMSRDDLAREIGSSYALVAQIETGWRMPSYEKQLLIAKALGTGLDELFGEDEDDDLDFLSIPPTTAGSAPTAVGSASAPASGAPDFFARAAAAFPLGAARRGAAPASSAPDAMFEAPAEFVIGSMPAPAAPTPARPTFDDAVERAAEALRTLPASRRLDALSRLQLSVMREVADEERRRVGSDSKPMGWITELAPGEVFVFGSDAEGHHSGGAARTAYEKFGAEWGVASGHRGQSYAIVSTRGLSVLRDGVADFVDYAKRHPDLRFLVTPIGTGVAGYRADEIAPLFDGAPGNVILPVEFREP